MFYFVETWGGASLLLSAPSKEETPTIVPVCTPKLMPAFKWVGFVEEDTCCDGWIPIYLTLGKGHWVMCVSLGNLPQPQSDNSHRKDDSLTVHSAAVIQEDVGTPPTASGTSSEVDIIDGFAEVNVIIWEYVVTAEGACITRFS